MKPSEILKGIKAGRRNKKLGICLNFRMYPDPTPPLTSAMAEVGIDFKDWPHYSGDPLYPIPSGNHIRPCIYYELVTRSKWDPKTNYGRLRLDLLDWLIQEFEKAGA